MEHVRYDRSASRPGTVIGRTDPGSDPRWQQRPERQGQHPSRPRRMVVLVAAVVGTSVLGIGIASDLMSDLSCARLALRSSSYGCTWHSP